MDKQKEISEMLDLMTVPAFIAADGQISYVNAAAGAMMLQPGIAVSDLIATGAPEYSAFTGGCMYLEISLEGCPRSATVRRMNEVDIFVVEPEETSAELSALSLAAQELREPLTAVLSLAQKLYDPSRKEEAAMLNKALYRLLRLTGNMADSSGLTHLPRMETVDLRANVEELVQKAALTLASCGIDLTFICKEPHIFCLADMPLLERALWNMISNAAKFTNPGGKIEAELTRQSGRISLSVTDSGCGFQSEILPTAFTRYMRQPGLEDSRYGIGLGMVIIRSAARRHGGTVLIDRPAQGGSRVTLTMAAKQNTDTVLRSPILFADYCGERDHALVELSELLSAEFYEDAF